MRADAGDATIVSMTPDRVEIEVRADGPAVLVLTDVMAPGWIAERDGVRVPIATVDRAFRGVAVDGSTSRVVFWYGPRFTVVGFLGAGLAFAGRPRPGLVRPARGWTPSGAPHLPCRRRHRTPATRPLEDR